MKQQDVMNVTVTVAIRTDQWKFIETREISAQVMSAKELEGLSYGLGELTQGSVTGIAKRLMAAEGMEGAQVEVVEDTTTKENI